MSLKRLFRSGRRGSSPGAQVLDLSSWNDGYPDSLTPITRPDALSPLDHTHPVTDPSLADARLTVTQLIAELAKRDALDEGNPDVLDDWIDKQLVGWQEAVIAQAESRRIVAARLLGVDEENLARESAELTTMRERMRRLRRAYAHWRDQLHGHPYVAPPATNTPERAAAPRLPDGPTGHPTARVASFLGPAQ